MAANMTFVRSYGWILIAFSALTLYFQNWTRLAFDYPGWFVYLGLGTAAFYGLAGVGLLLYRRWGYILLKVFLYFLILCFPIGTVISYKSLKYIKNNNIQRLFS